MEGVEMTRLPDGGEYGQFRVLTALTSGERNFCIRWIGRWVDLLRTGPGAWKKERKFMLLPVIEPWIFGNFSPVF
jgi:hypothetical protein